MRGITFQISADHEMQGAAYAVEAFPSMGNAVLEPTHSASKVGKDSIIVSTLAWWILAS